MKFIHLAIAPIVVLTMQVESAADVMGFGDIRLWAGSGSNEAALVVDWNDGKSPLAWGYRWDGAATGADMLLAITVADPRLYTSLNNTFGPGLFTSGFGYDRDDDGFSVSGGTGVTTFDADGIHIGAPSSNAMSVDAGDSYAETNDAPGATGFGDFWEYHSGTGNPYVGGSWGSSADGISDRSLTDGDWDGWYHPGFNGGTPGIAQAAVLAAVPEPGAFGTLTLLALAMVSIARFRKTWRSIASRG